MMTMTSIAITFYFAFKRHASFASQRLGRALALAKSFDLVDARNSNLGA